MAGCSGRIGRRCDPDALLKILKHAVDDRLNIRCGQSPGNSLGGDIGPVSFRGLSPRSRAWKEASCALDLGNGHHIVERCERGDHLFAVEKRRVLGMRIPVAKRQVRNKLAQQLRLLALGIGRELLQQTGNCNVCGIIAPRRTRSSVLTVRVDSSAWQTSS